MAVVRASAADALARYPAGTALDQFLAKALSDDSALVRARSVRALGERRAAGVASRVRDYRLVDAEEWPEVAGRSLRARSARCGDDESADVLAAFAKKLADPMASPDAQQIATRRRHVARTAGAAEARRAAGAPEREKGRHRRRAAAAATALAAQLTCRSPRKP